MPELLRLVRSDRARKQREAMKVLRARFCPEMDPSEMAELTDAGALPVLLGALADVFADDGERTKVFADGLAVLASLSRFAPVQEALDSFRKYVYALNRRRMHDDMLDMHLCETISYGASDTESEDSAAPKFMHYTDDDESDDPSDDGASEGDDGTYIIAQ